MKIFCLKTQINHKHLEQWEWNGRKEWTWRLPTTKNTLDSDHIFLSGRESILPIFSLTYILQDTNWKSKNWISKFAGKFFSLILWLFSKENACSGWGQKQYSWWYKRALVKTISQIWSHHFFKTSFIPMINFNSQMPLLRRNAWFMSRGNHIQFKCLTGSYAEVSIIIADTNNQRGIIADIVRGKPIFCTQILTWSLAPHHRLREHRWCHAELYPRLSSR